MELGIHDYFLLTSRTLDIFYLAQVATDVHRSTKTDDAGLPADFARLYAKHHALLDKDAWRQYYSPRFLAQATSARFYRMPDLQDLPDSSDPLGLPRKKGAGHFNKIPRWAHNVMWTHRRQPTLDAATMVDFALATLEQTIQRQRSQCPTVEPYSEKQARFWLDLMGMESSVEMSPAMWRPNEFGIRIAQGWIDTWAYEAHVRRFKSEVHCYGWPDGGAGVMAWWLGREPEVGSEEEIAFLAAVAVKETEGVRELDYAVRSHILLAVLRGEDVREQVVQAGRLDEEKAGEWLAQAARIMDGYARGGDESELLGRILRENGQLFARWNVAYTFPPSSKEFSFALKPRVDSE